jgi:hypothetical protein
MRQIAFLQVLMQWPGTYFIVDLNFLATRSKPSGFKAAPATKTCWTPRGKDAKIEVIKKKRESGKAGVGVCRVPKWALGEIRRHQELIKQNGPGCECVHAGLIISFHCKFHISTEIVVTWIITSLKDEVPSRTVLRSTPCNRRGDDLGGVLAILVQATSAGSAKNLIEKTIN